MMVVVAAPLLGFWTLSIEQQPTSPLSVAIQHNCERPTPSNSSSVACLSGFGLLAIFVAQSYHAKAPTYL